MASYFTGGGTDIQAVDGLQTLYLMNPGYTGFTDPSGSAAGPTNMVLLNSMTSLNPIALGHMSNQQPAGNQHIVGIPLQPPSQAEASQSPTPHTQAQAQYNIWAESQQTATLAQQGGLSLTLSSRELSVPVSVPASAIAPTQLGHTSPSSGGMHGFLMGSKYLKATQELLDEVVNVGKGGRGELGKGASYSNSKGGSKKENKEETEIAGGGQDEKKPAAAELTTAERQELQMKKAKLVNMLDEVEQRYRQYHHQMQVVVSSFEAVAGPGSARAYTSLALQTISKQFRCLRDAITGQIRSTSKSLGEEDTKTVGSRLRFIDHQLRQQRALQQLGMIQHNAWRPQRGLPERSVSILRAWLFEHFLHPYPKDSDKIMLAKQTGLTRSQVSNWFINARVRLWKPMVEEMYLEETKDQEKDDDEGDNSGKTDTDKDHNFNSAAQQNSIGSKPEQKNTSLSMTQTDTIDQIHSAPIVTQPDSFYSADEDLMQQKLKKVRSEESYQPNMVASGMGPRHEEVNNRELLMKFMEEGARVGFGSTGYTMADPMGRFDSDQFAPRYGGNGVSLTLGLPHCETMPMSGTQPSFLSNDGIRLEIGNEANEYCSLGNNSAPVAPHQPNAYGINLQSTKSFAAHLMRDFVA
ncbi:BEL1-like homeodomain protein 1 [Rhynchospora pubera]|uniref:BEL1-like homeodomain protein 1 n=1 Tax=Rhynchospora pubera TaxID=906938 RepID=A0AAV8DBX4_9POAL|nr:BEL1-like homeodomain protein 1 [Rhynchospora pubera]